MLELLGAYQELQGGLSGVPKPQYPKPCPSPTQFPKEGFGLNGDST